MAFKGIRFTYLNLRNTFSSSVAMKVALFGVLFIPVIFAGFYLSAFLDPYARLNTVQVAVVNEDAGAQINGVSRNLGKDVCNDLKNETDGLGWNFVSADEAQEGLEDGTYYMVCTIPSDFSEVIASADSEHPERASFTITYDESKNMLASQIGENVWKQVQQQVNTSIIDEYWHNVFGQMNDASGELREAADGANQLTDGLQTAHEGNVTITSNLRTLAAGSESLEVGLDQLSDGSQQIDAGAQSLSSGMNQLSAGSSKLVAGVQRLEGGLQVVNTYLVKVSESGELVGENLTSIGKDLKSAKNGLESASLKLNGYVQDRTIPLAAAQAIGADLAAVGAALTDAGDQATAAGATLKELQGGANPDQLKPLQDGAAELSAGLQSLAAGIDSAQAGANKLAVNTPALAAGAAQAQSGSQSIAAGANALEAGSEKLGDGLVAATDGSDELATALAEGSEKMQFSEDEINARAEAMSEPVELNNQYYTSVENYGAGFSPFFLGLGVWVGCIFAGFLFKPLNRRLCVSGANPFLVAFVGYIPLASFTILQTLIAQLFIQFGLGVHIANIPAYYGMGVLCALCFMAIMQFLVAAFGFPGRFIAIVLLTLQLTSAAGTFPVETAPEFFQVINPWMPMTYLVDGLREIMNGASMTVAAYDASILVAFTLVFFLLTVIVAYRNRSVKMFQLHPLLDL